MTKFQTTILTGLALAAALAISAPAAFARHGADDPVGHVRHGHGKDDGPGHMRRSRGADDGPGHHRQGHGNDDGPNHK